MKGLAYVGEPHNYDQGLGMVLGVVHVGELQSYD